MAALGQKQSWVFVLKPDAWSCSRTGGIEHRVEALYFAVFQSTTRESGDYEVEAAHGARNKCSSRSSHRLSAGTTGVARRHAGYWVLRTEYFVPSSAFSAL